MPIIKLENTATKETHYDKYNNYIKEKVHGSVCFICPHCKESIYIHADCNIKLHSAKSELDFASLKIKLACPDCGTEFTDDLYNSIDVNIIDTIQTLNQRGYPTVFSCEGDNSDMPYIMFGLNQDSEKWRTRDAADTIMNCLLHSGNILPYPWYIDQEVFHQEQHPVVVLRARTFSEEERIKALKSINAWAYELPGVTSINKYFEEWLDKHKKKKK